MDGSAQMKLSVAGTIQEQFVAIAAAFGDRPAVRNGDHAITYSQLNRDVENVAAILRSTGVVEEDRVGIYMERSLEMVVAVLGILSAGAAFVPLDISSPMDYINTIVADARCAVVLSTDRCRGRLSFIDVISLDLGGDIENMPRVQVNAFGKCLHSPKGLAYVMYTSGSTGRPKGVEVAGEALLNRINWSICNFPIGPSDRILFKTPIIFDVSLFEIFWTLLSGAELIVLPEEQHASASVVAQYIESYSIRAVHFVPTMLRECLIEMRERNVIDPCLATYDLAIRAKSSCRS